MNPTQGKEDKFLKPVHINKDVWFYPAKNRFEFVVYLGVGSERKFVQFNVTHKKIKKYL